MPRFIKRLEQRIEIIEYKLRQFECLHQSVEVYEDEDEDNYDCDVWGPGIERCSECGKIIQRYWDRKEYLNAKLRHESGLCTDKIRKIENEIRDLSGINK